MPATRGATLVGDGRLNDRVVDLLNAQGNTVAIAAADCAAADSESGAATTADLTPRRLSPQVVAAPFDPGVGAALAAAGTDPMAPSYLDSSLRCRCVTIRRSRGARTRWPRCCGEGWTHGIEPRGQILMPPWSGACKPTTRRPC